MDGEGLDKRKMGMQSLLFPRSRSELRAKDSVLNTKGDKTLHPKQTSNYKEE